MSKRRRRRRHKCYKNRNKKNQYSKQKDNEKENLQVEDLTSTNDISSTSSLINSIPIMDTTPVNKRNVLNRFNDEDGRDFCTNLNILFNETVASTGNGSGNVLNNISQTKMNTDIFNRNICNNKALITIPNIQPPPINDGIITNSNIIINNNINTENNGTIRNVHYFLNQGDFIDNQHDGFSNKPLYSSSPLCTLIKTNNEDVNKSLISNKAYKDELNLKRLNSYNDISIQTSCKVQCLVSPEFNINVRYKPNNLDALNSTQNSFCDYKSNNKISPNSTFKFSNKKKPPISKSTTKLCSISSSESFLHNISKNIISKIKRFHARYTSKWMQNIAASYNWISGFIKEVIF